MITAGRVTRNALLNLTGQAIPLLVAVFAIPILIHKLGAERFGMLSLIWVFVGYFGLFDLGLGRALIKLVAQALASDEKQKLPSLIWTAWALMFALGVIGACVLIISSSFLVNNLSQASSVLKEESLHALYLLAFSLPFITTAAGFRGVLEGAQKFAIVNAINSAGSLYGLIAPLLTIPFSTNVVLLAGVTIAGKLVTWGFFLRYCLRTLPALRDKVMWRASEAKALLSFGGWMTITNIISPFMVYLDRFLIGFIISISAVAYYTTPYDLITKIWIIPGAVVGALFPAFSASYSTNQAQARRLFAKAVKYVFFLLFPIMLVFMTFAYEGLAIWLNKDFANHSARVLQLLAFGVLVNSLAHVPFALIQGAGRPDLTAKLHLVELPFYLICLQWSLQHFGIVGAAAVWMLRVTVDALLLFIFAKRFIPNYWQPHLSSTLTVGSAFIGLFLVPTIDSVILRALVCSALMAFFFLSAYLCLLDSEEKEFVARKSRLASFLSRVKHDFGG